MVVFGKQAEPEGFEGQATICESTIMAIALAGLRDKYRSRMSMFFYV